MSIHTQREKRADVPTWSTVEFPNSGFGQDSNGNPFLKDAAGNLWRWIAGVVTAAAMTLTGALTAVAAVFTGRVTTTDGVVSGTARVVGGMASVLQAAGVSPASSALETQSASFTIPANTIKAGTVIRVRYKGIAPTTVGTDTLTIFLRLGTTTLTGTALITTAAVDVANNDTFQGTFELVGRAAPGAAAAIVGAGFYNDPAGTSMKPANLESTNFATNGPLILEGNVKFSTANNNVARIDVFNVEIIG